ncbi:substrate-binding domain-containing protein [Paenibacillus bovis]|uniref:LacI family transcriptional regulator n=1 Tax=Paenibacillus bovis TaxID=1616788 RepID=A0A172ZF40_9BACL|nr:substrate-binding domain-containing protein [Paenibacillus bovis]ANF95897.1 LacI family transcriptional regulator [Paenibacillus bovis]
MRKMLWVYAVLVVALIIYIVQYQAQETSSAWNEQGMKGNINEKYVMITFQSGIEYWKSGLKGFEDAAEALDVSVDYQGSTRYDAREQAMIVEQAIAKKPAGIAISAIDSPLLVQAVNKAVDAGIPVVMFDAESPGSKSYSFLATDNRNAGDIAAGQMAERTGGSGQVAIITLGNQQNHKDRSGGFEEAIRQRYPQMKVVAVENDNGDAVLAEQLTTRLLTQYPKLKGIFITEATGAYGVGSAVKQHMQTGQTGSSKKPVIISFDTNKETLDMIRSGTIDATIAQGTWNMGYWSLQYLFHLHHGLTVPAPSLSGIVSPVPVRVDTGVSVVTRENVEDYYAK